MPTTKEEIDGFADNWLNDVRSVAEEKIQRQRNEARIARKTKLIRFIFRVIIAPALIAPSMSSCDNTSNAQPPSISPSDNSELNDTNSQIASSSQSNNSELGLRQYLDLLRQEPEKLQKPSYSQDQNQRPR
jgi:hypothetical protein